MLDALTYDAGETYYEKKQAGTTHGYSNNSFPVSDTEVLSVTYYADYDLNADGTDDYQYVSQSLAGESSALTRPVGQVTATKTKVLNTADWMISYVFYDRYGNVIQARSNNHLQPGSMDNLATRVYDFNGRILLSKNYHNTGGGNAVTVVNRYNYDHAGRLLQVFQKNNSDAEVQVVSYRYNDLGQLVSKNLHCTTCTDDVVNPGGSIHAYNIVANTQQPSAPVELVAHNSVRLANGFSNTHGVSFRGRISSPAEHEIMEASQSVQSLDYRYNIRGWLTSINNAQLTNDGVRNDDINDLFGMELLYNKQESGLNDQAGDEQNWNGNISAIIWKGPGKDAGVAGQRSYKYKYDMADRLESAKFQAVDITAWSTELNAFNEALTYDHNGNIKTLQRNQRKHQWVTTEAAYTSEQIDNLAYTYSNSNQGNKLINVHDIAVGQGGFVNGSTTSASEYAYDSIGSLTRDDNKLISSVTYNVLGKVQQVSFTDSRTIQYTYDGSGTKLKMVVNPGNFVTDYVNGFVYEGGSLKFFGSPEGRVVKNGNGQYEYQYAIADHQGNTRVVFTSATPAADAPVATFEGGANDNAAQYQNVAATNVVSFTNANHTVGGSKVVRLNQTYKTGPGKSIRVFPGDAVDMEAWAYYEGSTGWGSTNTGATAWITTVAAGFGGSPTGSLESQAIYNGVNSAIGTFGMGGNQGNTKPSAYLNFILFDKDYKLLDMGWTPVPETANMNKQKLSIPTVKITEPGYIFVYLSYEAESNNWVYFDDLKVTQTKTNVLQYNEYYPFGLQTSTSWTREGHKNDFLYNSGSELNNSTQWYETMFRGYDAALGRFLQADPLAMMTSDMSQYQYGNNNPAVLNDPLGLRAYDPVYSDENTWNPIGGGSNRPGSGNHWSDPYRSDEEMAIFGHSGGYYVWSPWTQEYLPYNSIEARTLLKNKGDDPKVVVVRMDAQQGEWDLWGRGSVPYNGTALGGTNFIGPGPDVDPRTLGMRPIDEIDRGAFFHDISYFENRTGGVQGALLNQKVKEADLALALAARSIIERYQSGNSIDAITGLPISQRTYNLALGVWSVFAPITEAKYLRDGYIFPPGGLYNPPATPPTPYLYAMIFLPLYAP